MAHLTLIRPPAVSSLHAYSLAFVPPLGPAYLAGALLAAGHEVAVIDALGEAPLQRSRSVHPRLLTHGLTQAEIVARVPRHTQAIGISVMFSQQWPDVESLVLALAESFPNATIFAGGEHVTATWDYLLGSCPALTLCALGEGEETVVEIAEWVDGKRALTNVSGIAFRGEPEPIASPRRARIGEIDTIPLPAWHLFPLENYLSRGFGHGVDRGRSLPMLATRGCPYRCTFCSSPQMWTTRYYLRSVSRVVDEIEEYVRSYRISNIDFEDLTMFVRRDWVLDFAHELERRGLHITYQLPSGTRSEALDAEVLEALYRTGCRNITYAPESGSKHTLHEIKKKLTPGKVLQSMRHAKRLGINVKSNLMIGFPNENRRDLIRTLRFGVHAAWLGVDDLPLFPFSPYPGTELYNQLRQEGKLPELGNEYFASLGYMDITDTRSYSSYIGTSELNLYRIAGMSTFYLVGYLRRPGRFLRTVRNVLRGRSDSVLEQNLVALLRRRAVPSTASLVRG